MHLDAGILVVGGGVLDFDRVCLWQATSGGFHVFSAQTSEESISYRISFIKGTTMRFFIHFALFFRRFGSWTLIRVLNLTTF